MKERQAWRDTSEVIPSSELLQSPRRGESPQWVPFLRCPGLSRIWPPGLWFLWLLLLLVPLSRPTSNKLLLLDLTPVSEKSGHVLLDARRTPVALCSERHYLCSSVAQHPACSFPVLCSLSGFILQPFPQTSPPCWSGGSVIAPLSYFDPTSLLLFMRFFRQECWSPLPFPAPGILPDPGVEPGCPVLLADSLPSEPPGKQLVWWQMTTILVIMLTLKCIDIESLYCVPESKIVL